MENVGNEKRGRIRKSRESRGKENFGLKEEGIWMNGTGNGMVKWVQEKGKRRGRRGEGERKSKKISFLNGLSYEFR